MEVALLVSHRRSTSQVVPQDPFKHPVTSRILQDCFALEPIKGSKRSLLVCLFGGAALVSLLLFFHI